MRASMIQTTVFVSLAVCLAHCTKSSEKSANSNAPAAVSSDTQVAGPAEAVVEDYPKLYCKYADKLKLRTDATSELAFACQNGAPTPNLIAYRKKALEQAPGKIDLVLLKAKHDSENDLSEFEIAWSFHVPIRPFEVKSRPLYQFIAQGYASDNIELKASSSRRPDEQVDFGMHLWSVDMNYDLTVKGTQGLNLVNHRKTQYNLYQVMSGNEEMGLGVEHLVETDNPDYQKSTMMNFSFNDGQGYNDGKGGTVVVTMLHFVIRNQGFPATATTSIQDIAKHIADTMYQGLKE